MVFSNGILDLSSKPKCFPWYNWLGNIGISNAPLQIVFLLTSNFVWLIDVCLYRRAKNMFKKISNENMETPRRNMSVSMEQKRLIIEFIRKHPMLLSGKFNNDFNQKDSQLLWQKLTTVLNSCPGANKDWKSWRKTWQDIRSRTKVKYCKYRSERNATGGGVNEIDPITQYETEVLDVIKSVSVEGHTNIEESSTEFSFDMAEPNYMGNTNEDVINECTSSSVLSSNKMTSEAVHINTGDNIETINSKTLTKIASKGKFECNTNNLPKTRKTSRVPRKKLLNASQASEDYRKSPEQKNKIKKDYYEKKIVLLERMTVAKERSAVATEKIAENIEKLAFVIEEFL